ncbi:MAG: anthranilate synthase component I [Rhodobacteraceae bacterium]|nr:anthranilate synthase component I [Paracoccaceae bacterium]
MRLSPDFKAFQTAYRAGRPQVLWTTAPADLDTPVSLLLKLAQAGPDSFMLESVTGASARGRYSLIGWKPDLVWRCRNVGAGEDAPVIGEVNRAAAYDRDAFEPLGEPTAEGALAGLRQILEESRIELPEDLPPIAAGLYGYLGYDMARLVEKLPPANPDVLNVPDAVLLRPSIVAVVDNAFDTVTLVAPVRPQKGVNAREAYGRAAERLSDALNNLDRPLPHGDLTDDPSAAQVEPVSNTTPERYLEMVAQAKEYIAAGDAFQIVPSQRWKFPFALPPIALYRALRRTNPSPYMFFFNFAAQGGPEEPGADPARFGGFQIAGASPEILVRVETKRETGDNIVTIRPIAGTRPRGATRAEDQALEDELLADPKELAEHLMLLDLGRNDVGRVAKIGTVDPNAQFSVERYSHVMHIVSNVDGVLRDDHDALSALLAGLPAGTVSGAPKIRAMEIIDELESEKRGVYAGGVGYFSANGDMDTCIALRTAVLKDGHVYVQAGGGVVADSDPQAEWQETVNKAKAVIRAAEEAGRFAARGNR